MTSGPTYQVLFLDGGPQMLGGVGRFARRLSQTMDKLDPGSCAVLTLTATEGSPIAIWRAVGSAQSVVCNFPMVDWKYVVLRPLLAIVLARLRRRRVVLMLHEWAGLHWLRRLTVRPALGLADRIVMFSPLIRRQLAADRLAGRTAEKCVLAPLPPSIEAPAGIADSRLRQRLAAARQQGRLVIGYFGSIAPGKRVDTLLAIGAELKQRGLKPLMVYFGSFIHGFKQQEEFYARAAEQGVAGDILVSGYIESEHEIFGLFSEIDAFCYLLDEGITARRGSVLATVQSGRPVIVTAAAEADEFDHHPRFRQLIDHGAIQLVPHGAREGAYADQIVAALETPATQLPFQFDSWWDDVAKAVAAQCVPSPDQAGDNEPNLAVPVAESETARPRQWSGSETRRARIKQPGV